MHLNATCCSPPLIISVRPQKIPSWSSPSLRNDTVVGPNGTVTTRTALLANEKWGIGDARIRRLELRNGVLVITDAEATAPSHPSLTRKQLSAFVLGTRLASAEDPLNQLNRVLNRSHLMPPGEEESVMKGMKATGAFEP